MEKFGLIFVRKLQRIARAGRSDFKSFNAQAAVVSWAGRRGKIENVVDSAEIEWRADVMLLKFKARFRSKMR
jgi:hypothetical protein